MSSREVECSVYQKELMKTLKMGWSFQFIFIIVSPHLEESTTFKGGPECFEKWFMLEQF